MRKTAALYPFCAELLPFVRHFNDLQDEYVLSALISPPGLALAGKDAGHSCNHPEIGLEVIDTLNINDTAWEVLLLVDILDVNILPYEILENIMENTLSAGKTVCYYTAQKSKITDKMLSLYDRYNENLKFIFSEITLNRITNNYYNIFDVPVVLVGGLLQEADVSEVTLSLAAQFRANGSVPLVLTAHPINRMFGFYSYSHIFEQPFREEEKIQNLNTFIKNLELAELPDVILIEAPDAIMRYNDFAPNGFGIGTYMLSQAIPADYFICCMPFEMAVEEFINMISKDIANRIKSPINSIHVSNVIVDLAEIMQSHYMSIAHADMQRVIKHMEQQKDCKIPLFNVVTDGSNGLLHELLS